MTATIVAECSAQPRLLGGENCLLVRFLGGGRLFLERLLPAGGGGLLPAFDVWAGLDDHSRLQLASRTCVASKMDVLAVAGALALSCLCVPVGLARGWLHGRVLSSSI